jgi:hypothetical protein
LGPWRRGRLLVGVAGVALVALAVATFESLVPQAPHSRQVLVAARAIRAGQTIGGGDLAVMTVASANLTGVPVSERDRVVGRTAGFDVAPGQPLVPADVAGAPGPGSGEAVVGLSLAAGRLPDGLTPGDVVVVVDTPARSAASATAATGAAPSGGPVELATGRVFSLGRSPDGTRTDLSLVVPAGAADGVAQAAAADEVSVAWVSR